MNYRKIALAVSASVTAMISSQAAAQAVDTPPVHQSVDENGVDLARGTLTVISQEVSIGADAAALAYVRIQSADDLRSNLIGSLDIDGTTVTVSTGRRSETFTNTGSDYVSNQASGSTLTFDAATNRYTYTDDNGEVSVFVASATGYQQFGTGGYIESTTGPDGNRLSYHNATGQWCQAGYDANGNCTAPPVAVVRVQSVTNNSGYQLKLEYAANSLAPGVELQDWYRVTKVTAINHAVEYCDPLAASCSLAWAWPSATFTRSGNTETTTDAAMTQRQRTVDAAGRITGLKRPLANSANTTIAYHPDGKVQSVTHEGLTTTYNWSDQGTSRVLTKTSPGGLVVQISSDADTGLITGSTDNLGRTFANTYYPSGQLKSTTYPEGNSVHYIYDARGNVITETRKAKPLPQLAEPGSGLADATTLWGYHLTCTNVRTCNKPVWVRDANNSQTMAGNHHTEYEYDPDTGQLTAVTFPPDANGVWPQTRYQYEPQYAWIKNASGALVQAATPVSKLTRVSTCRTQQACTGSADELLTVIAYQPGSAAIGSNALPYSQTVKPGDNSLSATTTLGYDAGGNITMVDGPLAGSADTTVYYYDALRRVVGTISPDPDGAGPLPNLAQRLTIDADGKVTMVEQGFTNGQNAAAWAAFSSNGQTVTGYDGNARQVSVTVKTGSTVHNRVQYSHDSAGRVECAALRMNPAEFASPLPANACTAGTAGAHGPDRVTRFGYDLAGRRTSVESAFGTAAATVETLAYNPNGTVSHVTDGEGNRTTYEYDGFDRLKKTRYPVPTAGADASSATDFETYQYDLVGNLTQVRKRDDAVLEFEYDALNRLTRKVVPERPWLDPTHTRDVYYGYDLQGQLRYARFDSHTGQGVTNTFDALGRANTANLTMDSSWTIGSTYDIAGNCTHVTHPDGVYFQMGYDVLGRMDLAWWHSPAGGYVLHSGYQYDAQGRRATLGRANSATYYSYDAAGRMASQLQAFVQNSAANNVTDSFAYNPANQLAGRTRSNDDYAWQRHYNQTRSYTANGLNQYTTAGAASFAHDANGNLITETVPTESGTTVTTRYYYDVENRLVAAYRPEGQNPQALVAALKYDPLGRLYEVSGSAANSTTRFVYDGDHIALEYDTAGTVLRRYFWGTEAALRQAQGDRVPIIWDEGAAMNCTNTRFLLRDRLGSVVAGADCSGARTFVNRYDGSVAERAQRGQYGIPALGNSGGFDFGRSGSQIGGADTAVQNRQLACISCPPEMPPQT